MKNIYNKVRTWWNGFLKAITPSQMAITGAAFFIVGVTGFLYLLFAANVVVNIRDPWVLILFVSFALLSFLIGRMAVWLMALIQKIPVVLKMALLVTIPLLIAVISIEGVLLAYYLLVCALVGASLHVLFRNGWSTLKKSHKVWTAAGLILGLAGVVSSVALYIPRGFEMDEFVKAASLTEVDHIEAENPAQPGDFPVLQLTYGSGKDRHRVEFGVEVDVKTDSVDGTVFIDNWKGISGWWRQMYWGFDYKSLPLNGRVWYPEGDGPFPLVLVVHGNHSMQDYSDPGYDYLGELLASRGMILVSVDENFINGSWSDIIQNLTKENDARGWLLLEHLRIWHEWNRDMEHLFGGKVDTSRIALIGHSRGGEAVGHAAMLNKLPYYPDDALTPLDYNFDIKAVVAIAPVDGQYEPGNSRTKFDNVDYFVIHGAQDADVSSYMGSMQYERIGFTDSLYHFKSGLYVYGANHGQFNSSWGNNDTGNPFIGFLNLEQLMPAEDQQEIAKVFISGFLESSLNGRREYIPLFLDARTGKNWLPETTYLSQFEDSNTRIINSFDEDFDLTTGSLKGVSNSTSNLTVWKEREIQLKWQEKGSRALFLGWKRDAEEEDSVGIKESKSVPAFTIEIDTPLNLALSSALVFSAAESTESSNPRSGGKWERENDVDENIENDKQDGNRDEANKDEKTDEEEEDQSKTVEDPIDFTIELIDSAGHSVHFPLSSFSALQRELEIRIWKEAFLNGESQSEKVFQTFYFPLGGLVKENSTFEVGALRQIRFLFDSTDEGVIVVDNIGFTKDIKRLKTYE